MGIYLPNGYVDFGWLYNRPVTWSLVTGGRGTGKTYGALKYVLEHDIRFIYLRRTQAQADLISKDEFSPFKSVARDMALDIGTRPITKYNAAFYRMETSEENKRVPAGPPIGYTAALSTFANIRGFDASDIQCIIYDEFIPEQHERGIKHEFEALANAYETVNRNRELSGNSPCRLIGLSNSNDLVSDIYIGLGVVGRLSKMIEHGEYMYEDQARGLGLYILQQSPISAQKQDTALYRLAAGTAFEEMAISNEFVSSRSSVSYKSINLRELRPIAAYGELCLYKIKSGGYYASLHISGSCPRYLDTSNDQLRFRRAYYWFYLLYLDSKVICENVLAENLLLRAFA